MKRVAIVSRALRMNGATKALVEMLKRINYSDCTVDLWVLNWGDMSSEWVKEIPKSVKIRKIPQYERSNILQNALIHPIHFIRSIYAGIALRREKRMIYQWKYTAWRLPCLKETYDIAISFRHFDIDVFYTMENIKASKKFFWVHGVQPLEPMEVGILAPYYYKYDGVYPVSITAKNNIIKYFPKLDNRCKVAYCVVDSAQIIEKTLRAERFQQKDDFCHIFTIGRLGHEKGMDIAVEAASILKKDGVPFCWYIAGEGPERDSLEKLIQNYDVKDCFILLGSLYNPYGFLDSCEIYVQPSRLESYGLSINEAKILNKPIICNDIPAGREQIDPMQTGIFFDGTPVDLADKVKLLINNKQLQSHMTKQLESKDWSHDEAVHCFNQLISTEG